MISKNRLLTLALPFSITTAFAAPHFIPQAQLDLEFIAKEKSILLTNAKGTQLGLSLKDITPKNWYNLSPSQGVEGVRTDETYVTFSQPASDDIIVAVIDSGVDVNHEDLQGKIWINSGEIPDNGIDDDNNGYIDDVFGWNFIGGTKGQAQIVEDNTLENGYRLIKGDPAGQVDADTLEVTRELVRMKKEQAKPGRLSSKDAKYLRELTKIVKTKQKEAKRAVKKYIQYLRQYNSSAKTLKAAGLATITLETLNEFKPVNFRAKNAKKYMLILLNNGLTLKRINRVLDYYKSQKDYYYNESFNSRTIVGDNYFDTAEKNYGNNDVIGPDSSHGTHVSGSIAASRNNGIGINGVATNVKIMALRAIPNGDERDKDVANSIRYAVDNGAKIINMSFGKGYSPYKSVVDEAVQYAQSKGVLLVHAAGNSSLDIDVEPNFPNRRNLSKGNEFSNWLEIGASSLKKGASLPARFSNYGKKSVDLFAPGVDILSTTPDNSYDTYSGTSMACPTAAGVAALVLSHNESLTASELRSTIIETSRSYKGLKVNLPGTNTKVLFDSLSRTGTIVDAFEAVKSLK